MDNPEMEPRELVKRWVAAFNRGDADELAQILLYFRDRNRLLQHACQAAEIYLRSGLGEHEHAVLVKRLADLEDSSGDIDL